MWPLNMETVKQKEKLKNKGAKLKFLFVFLKTINFKFKEQKLSTEINNEVYFFPKKQWDLLLLSNIVEQNTALKTQKSKIRLKFGNKPVSKPLEQ